MKSKVTPGRYPEFKERLNILAMKYKSTTEFAAALGISRQTVGFWLNGNRVPDADSLITISEKMKVSVDWLLGLSEVKNFAKEPDLREICDYTGLSPYAVQVLSSQPRSEFINYLIANSSSSNNKSYLYYISHAELVAKYHSQFGFSHSEFKSDNGHIEYTRDKKDNSFGLVLNDKESIQYLVERSKYILSSIVENYIMEKWEGKTPEYLIDRFKIGYSIDEDGTWEYELDDNGEWKKHNVEKRHMEDHRNDGNDET